MHIYMMTIDKKSFSGPQLLYQYLIPLSFSTLLCIKTNGIKSSPRHVVYIISTVNSRLADTSLLRTLRSYYGQESKSRRIRITKNNSRYMYYGLPLLRTQNCSAKGVRYSGS